MMKVCMIVQKFYHNDARVRSYAEGLAAAGAQVDVLCLQDPGNGGEVKGGVRLFPVPLRRATETLGGHLFEYGAGGALFALRLVPLYLKNRYQVIHVHNMPDFLIFSALLPKLLGANLILDIHDPMPEFYQSKYQDRANRAVVRFMRAQEKISSMFADAVITANPNFKNNLIKRGIPGEKITIVNNLPNPNIFNRELCKCGGRRENGRFTLIYPGTIAPRYHLDVAIRALPYLRTKIPGIRLLIIGEQVDHVNDLRRLVEELDVLPLVDIKPHMPVQQVPLEMIQADVGIYTALPDAHMDIAMPVKVVEYAAMGIPIVASRLNVLEDAFPSSAVMFFEPGNVDQFASCVLELYRNPERRAELVENADRLFVRTHSWSDEQRTYFDLLNRLVGSGEQLNVSATNDEHSAEKAR